MTAGETMRETTSEADETMRDAGVEIVAADAAAPAALLRVEQARAMLAECRSIDAAKDVRDKAKAMAVYYRERTACLDAANDAAEIQLRAERRIGELSRELPRKQGVRSDLTSGGVAGSGVVVAPKAKVIESMGVEPRAVRRFEELAAIPDDAFDRYVQTTRDKQRKITTSGAINAVTDAADYQSDEWYTPVDYIEAARRALGGIDLDPASSDLAQTQVKAGAYYTREQDGLSKPWFGNVWMNPPYSQPLVQRFAEKFLQSYVDGDTQAGIALFNASTDTRWFHLLAEQSLVCLTAGRIGFETPSGPAKGNRVGQVFFYLGEDDAAFIREFKAFGAVLELVDGQ